MASSIAVVLCLFLAINMVLPTLGKVHTVGETSGWAIGADYSTWANDKTFVVGDSLVFNYGAGHTVDEVKEKDYKSCTTGNSLSTDSSGATSIALKTAGTHYFICAAPGHCTGGMKLAITVKAKKATAPALAPAPSSKKGSPSDDDTKGTPSATTPTTGTATAPTTSTTTTPTKSNKSKPDSSVAPSRAPIVAVLIVAWISYYVLLRMA